MHKLVLPSGIVYKIAVLLYAFSVRPLEGIFLLHVVFNQTGTGRLQDLPFLAFCPIGSRASISREASEPKPAGRRDANKVAREI
jgi:hypothetical protein